MKRSLEDGQGQAEGAKIQAAQDDGAAPSKPTDSVEKHPGPTRKAEEVERCEIEWRDIGSGTVARTFIGATKLQVMTRNGPPACDIYRRTVRYLGT